MKMKKALILLLILPMLSLIIADAFGEPGTTIGVEPLILDPTLAAGSTFTVEIWIRNAIDLVGVEFKLSYNTAILTATQIQYGGIFGPTHFLLTSKIYDSAGYLHYSDMQWFLEPGISGDAKAAIITFKVDSEGETVLDLYNTKLGNSVPMPIEHDAIDGFCSTRWPSGTLPSDVYVGLNTGFVADRHLTISKDGTIQTLTGQIENMGAVPTLARVRFKVLLFGGPIPGGDMIAPIDPILPGQSVKLSKNLDVTTLERPAEYTVEVWVEYYSFTGWTLGRHGDPLGAKTSMSLFFKLED